MLCSVGASCPSIKFFCLANRYPSIKQSITIDWKPILWLSIGHRLADTNRYQFSNDRFIDWISDDRFYCQKKKHRKIYYLIKFQLPCMQEVLKGETLKDTPITNLGKSLSCVIFTKEEKKNIKTLNTNFSCQKHHFKEVTRTTGLKRKNVKCFVFCVVMFFTPQIILYILFLSFSSCYQVSQYK